MPRLIAKRIAFSFTSGIEVDVFFVKFFDEGIFFVVCDHIKSRQIGSIA